MFSTGLRSLMQLMKFKTRCFHLCLSRIHKKLHMKKETCFLHYSNNTLQMSRWEYGCLTLLIVVHHAECASVAFIFLKFYLLRNNSISNLLWNHSPAGSELKRASCRARRIHAARRSTCTSRRCRPRNTCLRRTCGPRLGSWVHEGGRVGGRWGREGKWGRMECKRSLSLLSCKEHWEVKVHMVKHFKSESINIRKYSLLISQ